MRPPPCRGRTFGGVQLEEIPQPRDALRVEAVGRFVENEDVGLAQHRAGELEALAHAHREATNGPVPDFGQADKVEALIDPAER